MTIETAREIMKKIKRLQQRMLSFEKDALTLGWEQGQHIFHVLGEIDYHRFNCVCEQHSEAKARRTERIACLKEQLDFLDKTINDKYCGCNRCPSCKIMITNRTAEIKAELEILEGKE